MKSFYLFLQPEPRELHGIPEICTTSYRKSVLAWKHSVSLTFQFCFRFSGEKPKLICSVNGERYEEKYPHLQIKRPGEVFDRLGECGYEEELFITYAPTSESVFYPHGLPQAGRFFSLDDVQPLIAPLHRLGRLVDSSGDYGQCARIDLAALELIREFFFIYRRKDKPNPMLDNRMARLISYLRLHFSDSVDLEELAVSFGFSPRTLTRNFRRAFNQSPGQYLMALKLKEAQHLLQETDYTTEYIANSLGYSCSHFCYMFKRATGVSPLEFRRNAMD